MGKIYNIKTKKFNFDGIVIVHNISFEYVLNHYSDRIFNILKYKDDSIDVIFKQIHIDDFFYFIKISFNSSHIIKCLKIEINTKEISYPKRWEDYDRNEEDRKKIIHDKWIEKECIINNDIFEVRSTTGVHIYAATICILYKNMN